MKAVAALLLAAGVLAAGDPPVIPRTSVERIERGFDKTIAALDPNDPFDLLGLTRGVYLDGYGIVFTTELNLVLTPISPFHPKPDAAGLAKLHSKKLQRLVLLKDRMRKVLVQSAGMLGGVPADEQVVFAITLLYRSFENREGLPDQVIMQAPLQVLLDIKAGREPAPGIRVQER